jgi:hypothetical protein
MPWQVGMTTILIPPTPARCFWLGFFVEGSALFAPEINLTGPYGQAIWKLKMISISSFPPA